MNFYDSVTMQSTHPVSVGTYLLHLEPLGTVTLCYLSTHLMKQDNDSVCPKTSQAIHQFKSFSFPFAHTLLASSLI